MAHGDVSGCHRLSFTSEHARHEPIRGRRHRRHEAACSSGNYINMMSYFCSGCLFDYEKRFGDHACSFTTLYWEFMDRHYNLLKENQGMQLPIIDVTKMRQK